MIGIALTLTVCGKQPSTPCEKARQEREDFEIMMGNATMGHSISKETKQQLYHVLDDNIESESLSANMKPEGAFKSYILNYKGYGNCDCKCGVMIWYNSDGKKKAKYAPVVVLMIELIDNHGTSVTNMSEHIATHIWKRENLPVFAVQFFEAYEQDLMGKGGFRLREDAIDKVNYVLGDGNDVIYSKPKLSYYGMAAFKALLKNTFGVVFDDDYLSKIDISQLALNSEK